jgi:hypothetical protein
MYNYLSSTPLAVLDQGLTTCRENILTSIDDLDQPGGGEKQAFEGDAARSENKVAQI